jgi:hypothetical protein
LLYEIVYGHDTRCTRILRPWKVLVPSGYISNNNARPAKPDDKYLARLEAECRAEELKARIRATKMMSQGISYS